jgi:hypothetical protein
LKNLWERTLEEDFVLDSSTQSFVENIFRSEEQQVKFLDFRAVNLLV